MVEETPRDGGEIKRIRKTRAPTLTTAIKKVPTPQAQDWRSRSVEGAKRAIEKHATHLNEAIESQGGGQLNPPWVEWLMGLPIGWTDLKPLAMELYQQWLQSFSGG